MMPGWRKPYRECPGLDSGHDICPQTDESDGLRQGGAGSGCSELERMKGHGKIIKVIK